MSKSIESFNLHDISPFIKIAILITMLNALILNFKGHFKGLGVNHIFFYPKLIYAFKTKI